MRWVSQKVRDNERFWESPGLNEKIVNIFVQELVNFL